ncbi:chromosome segregation protein SMC [Calorimonas adulescens]|uniref:Chromosome partition protein Smc n=1 Tax=Calorimonas adulescens TaxID=2606906 RepID=A0A5D8QFB6_9THEO|nr:chromosome segregation protein SMC [Calorimonas adulescens]TZE83380.1 chromosome segregation protein SMC [Calorimonas adulescens]
MYLKRLEIYGFKSFAEKTVFDFEKGITCVIGPNGTGKSNLVDAILWVLGSQNPRDLRGGKMEDIIFNGTDKRKPLGFTYVTIVLDNADRLIPIDHSEISITRKFYRSGESEFYINNVECRLKDIVDLFTDTGLGKNGYSIIGQGKIEEILNSRPDEKRGLFEEAAGIVKYKNKRYESLKKLDMTQDNLSRLNDIISELYGRLKPLQEESLKASEYLKLSQRYKTFKINQYLLNYASMEKESTLVGSAISTERDKLENLSARFKEVKIEHDELRGELENLKNDRTSIRTNLYDANTELEKNRGEIKLINLQLSEESKKLDETDQKILGLISEIRKRKAERNELIQKVSNLSSAGLKIDIRLKNYITNMEIISGAIDKISEFHKNVIQRKDLMEREVLIKNNEIKHVNLNISEKINRNNALTERLGKLRSEHETIKQELLRCFNERRSLNRAINTIKNKISQNDRKLNERKDIYLRYIDESNRIKKSIQIINTRIKALEDMKKNNEGLNDGVRYVLGLKDPNVYGFVGELIELDKKYERAIETALGNSVEYIIVKTEDDAKRLITLLKSKKAGRATFIPLSSIKPRKYIKVNSHGFLGRAAELVKYDLIFRDAIEFLLGNIYVYDNVDNAIISSKKYNYSIRAVTLDGDIISPGGLITGGFYKKGYNFLSRENESKKLRKDISESIVKLKDNNERITKLSTDLKSIEENLKNLDDTLFELTNKKSYVDERIRELIHNYKNIGQNISTLSYEIDLNNHEISERYNELNTLEHEIHELESKIEQSVLLDKNFVEVESELKNKYEEIKNKFNDFRIENAHAVAEKDNMEAQLKEIEVRLNEDINSLQLLLNTRSYLRDHIKNLRRNLTDEKVKGQNLSLEIEKFEKEIVEIEQKIVITEEKIRNISSIKENLSNELALVSNNLSDLELKYERIKLGIENLHDRLKDEFNLTIEEALSYRDESIDYKNIQKEINFMKDKLDSLGTININSIEEYKNTKERYDFLLSQYRDVLESKNSLEKIIRETDRIIYDRFNSFLKRANNTFRENFIKLFGGGQASIVLTDADHPDESGIDIIVQLPGKRLQSMSLLSGGERTLVSIALLFSLLQLNPSPFVVLDEIDAALDDANIDRFINFLRQLSREIQFILITHRPGTTDAADVLYGITMEEKGVTKKISIKLSDAANWR